MIKWSRIELLVTINSNIYLYFLSIYVGQWIPTRHLSFTSVHVYVLMLQTAKFNFTFT